MENKRLTDIAYLRTFAIFAIVLYHAFCPYMEWKFVSTENNYIYQTIFKVWLAARMPLFLFISGFLFSYLVHVKNKYASLPAFVWNKSKRLLLPYLIFAVLMMWSHHALSWINLQNGYWHLWFLLTLFLCFIATRLLKYIDHPIFHIAVLIGLMCLSFYFKTKIRFGVNHFVYWYVYFYFGYVIARYRDKLEFLFAKRFVVGFLVLWVVLNIIRSYMGVPNRYLLFSSNISFILMVYGLLQQLLKSGVVRDNTFVEKMNTYSYGIYVFHAWFISLLFVKNAFYSDFIYHQAQESPLLFPIVVFVLIFSFCTGLTALLLKTKFGRFLIG